MQIKLLLASALAAEGAFAASAWGQCGGQGFSGDASCPSGYTCTYSNAWYSQCLPGSSNPTTTARTTTTVRPGTTTTVRPGTTTTRTTTSVVSQPTSGPASSITVYTKCKQANVLAVTFDDGPATYQQSIIDQFAAAGGKTTFFLNGNLYRCIYQGADTILAAYKAGHQIAAHSWSHQHMTSLSASQQESEIKKVDDALAKIIGAKPTYMRPPYGETNSALNEVARKLGYRAMINWDIDTEDWNGKTPAQSLAKFTAADTSGHISLSHENYQSTVQTFLPSIIQYAKSKNLKLVTVGECLGESQSLWYKEVGSPKGKDSTWVC
ncbi:hypothetical protein HK097_000523 [Rhizophlyctis rosea]|uniref:Chitin deacetylase n=1 Tax=Rhizophlyctis rosea TaxID=64517 RepID=A0AAD5S5E5_9FUNG|nr:hypothetical protein HK097_000523 [Rhizophlyctis rosea]